MAIESIILKLKQIFTIKRILIVIFAIFWGLFCIAGFSTALMDWQFYKVGKINKICSGDYIFDDKLYEEAKRYGNKIAVLSNGFPIKRESLLIDTQYSRIKIIGRTIFFIDNSNNKHIIYQVREYRQRNFELSLKGDEAAGFRIGIWGIYDLPNANNIFYIEDYNNSKKEICE